MTIKSLPVVQGEPDDERTDQDIEPEDTGSGAVPVKPWDTSKIRITTKSFSLREVVEQINQQEIDLAPDFQRDFVWTRRQTTRLIESILLGIPLPTLYFSQERDGRYQVVDGVRRLWAIRSFMSDEHMLGGDDLEYLRDLTGLTYLKLDAATKRRFSATQIVVHVIEPQTPAEIKYEIFSRVNTLGEPLAAQEIRHAMSKERSRRFLQDLVYLSSFDAATERTFWRRSADAPNDWVRDSKRMIDRELALRFCAFSSFSEDDYRQHETLGAFLMEFTRRIDGRSDRSEAISDEALNALRESFDHAMVNAWKVLGGAAFRRWHPDDQHRGPINRAVFESQAIALAAYPLERLFPKADELVATLRMAFDDNDYMRAVTVDTGNPVAIRLRLGRTRKLLAKVVG